MEMGYIQFLAGPQKCVFQIAMENLMDTGDENNISL
jgi:hypothetical protein